MMQFAADAGARLPGASVKEARLLSLPILMFVYWVNANQPLHRLHPSEITCFFLTDLRSASESFVSTENDPVLCLFQFCATLGTTSSCAFDHISELGPICKSTAAFSM